MRVVITDRVREEARALVRSGVSKAEASRMMGFSLGQIKGMTKGLKSHYTPGKFHSEESKCEARRLRAEGCSFKSIAARTGIPFGSLGKIIYEEP